MEKYGINQASLANRLGKNQSTISNKIRILSLPEDIQIMLVNHKLTERHARALLKVDDDNERRLIVEKVIKHGFNVRQTEKLVEEYMAGKAVKERERNKVRHISYKLYASSFGQLFVCSTANLGYLTDFQMLDNLSEEDSVNLSAL